MADPPKTTDDLLWQVVARRDTRYDGFLVYGVVTTRVFCRPGCPSRRPRRENVRFFPDPHAAAAAGYRPCKRCRPENFSPLDDMQRVVLEACRILRDAPGNVAAIAPGLGLSPRTLNEIFRSVLGISPRQYRDAVRMGALRSSLRGGAPVTEAMYDAGYGSSSRLYEKTNEQLGMTPRAYARGGEGETIGYATVKTRLGAMLVAGTTRGLCTVSLGPSASALHRALTTEYPHAILHEDAAWIADWTRSLVEYIDHGQPWPLLPVHVRATAFQALVWKALRTLPAGVQATYSEIADQIGRPRAVRAVARACATNPVALAIPCHRVLPKGGGHGGYRWGVERKAALLDLERSEVS